MANIESGLQRSTSNPLATSALVIACFALIGAIIFNLYEIGELRGGRVGTENASSLVNRDVRGLEQAVQEEKDALLKEFGAGASADPGAEDSLEDLDEPLDPDPLDGDN